MSAVLDYLPFLSSSASNLPLSKMKMQWNKIQSSTRPNWLQCKEGRWDLFEKEVCLRGAAKTWGYIGRRHRSARCPIYTHKQKNVLDIKPLKHTLKGTSQNSIELEREFTTDKHYWVIFFSRKYRGCITAPRVFLKELTRNVSSLLLGTTKDLLGITEAGFSIR